MPSLTITLAACGYCYLTASQDGNIDKFTCRLTTYRLNVTKQNERTNYDAGSCVAKSDDLWSLCSLGGLQITAPRTRFSNIRLRLWRRCVEFDVVFSDVIRNRFAIRSRSSLFPAASCPLPSVCSAQRTCADCIATSCGWCFTDSIARYQSIVRHCHRDDDDANIPYALTHDMHHVILAPASVFSCSSRASGAVCDALGGKFSLDTCLGVL